MDLLCGSAGDYQRILTAMYVTTISEPRQAGMVLWVHADSRIAGIRALSADTTTWTITVRRIGTNKSFSFLRDIYYSFNETNHVFMKGDLL